MTRAAAAAAAAAGNGCDTSMNEEEPINPALNDASTSTLAPSPHQRRLKPMEVAVQHMKSSMDFFIQKVALVEEAMKAEKEKAENMRKDYQDQQELSNKKAEELSEELVLAKEQAAEKGKKVAELTKENQDLKAQLKLKQTQKTSASAAALDDDIEKNNGIDDDDSSGDGKILKSVVKPSTKTTTTTTAKTSSHILEEVSTSIQSLSSFIECPVCFETMVETHVSPECQHRLCGNCFKESLRKCNNECPQCRVGIPTRRHLRPDGAFDELIDALKHVLKHDANGALKDMVKMARDEGIEEAANGDLEDMVKMARDEGIEETLKIASENAIISELEISGKKNGAISEQENIVSCTRISLDPYSTITCLDDEAQNDNVEDVTASTFDTDISIEVGAASKESGTTLVHSSNSKENDTSRLREKTSILFDNGSNCNMTVTPQSQVLLEPGPLLQPDQRGIERRPLSILNKYSHGPLKVMKRGLHSKLSQDEIADSSDEDDEIIMDESPTQSEISIANEVSKTSTVDNVAQKVATVIGKTSGNTSGWMEKRRPKKEMKKQREKDSLDEDDRNANTNGKSLTPLTFPDEAGHTRDMDRQNDEKSGVSSTSTSISTSTSTSIKSYEAWTSVWSKLETLGWTEVTAGKRKKAVKQCDFYYLPPNETKKRGVHGVNYFYEEAMRDYVRVEYGWKGEKETRATKVKESVKPPVKSVEMKNTSKKGKGKGKKSDDKKVTPKKSSISSKKAKHSKKDMAKVKKEKKAASSKSNKKVKEKESKSKKRKNNDNSGSKSKKMAISPSVQSSTSTLSSHSPAASTSSSASSLLSLSQITWKILKQEANWSYCTALNLFDSFSYLRPGITGKYCRSKDSDVVEGVHWFRTQEDAVAYANAHPEFLPVGMRVNAEAEPAEAAEVESPSSSPSVASPSSANSGDTFIPLSIADHPNPWWIDDKLPKFNWQRLRACFPSNDKPNGGGFQYRSSGYITPDGNKYESVEAMARGVCRHGLPRAEMEALSPVDREYIERYFSMAYLPIKIGKRSIRSGSNSVQILSELLEHELGMGRSFTSDMAWDALCAHFECHQTGEGQYHAPIVHVPLEMGMETDDDNDNDYGDKKESMHMFDSLHDVRKAIRSYGLNFLSGQDELMDQYYAAIILWSTALPLPLYETNTESESIANTSTDSKVDESQSKEEEEEQLESQTKKQDASVVEPKETETVIVLDDDKEEEDKKKDDILPDYSESEDDGNNDNDDDDDTSKAQIALSSKDVDASVVVANDDNDDDGADVPIEDIQSNVSKPSVDIANEAADIMCNDDVEKDADSSTMKSAQEVGIDADATTTTTIAVTTPAEQEHINPNSNAHDDKHNDDLDMNMNDPNSKDLQVKHMPSLFEAEMEEDTEESTPVDVETTKAMASQVAADVNKVAKETEIVDPTIDADSQMVLVDDSERSLQMENGLNSQDVESKSKEGTDDVDTQMVLVASEACTETSTGTLVEIQKVSTLQVDVVERSSLEETNVEEQLTTMKAGVPKQAQSVGVSVLESPILEDPAPQDSISYQQPYRCSLRSLPPPENEKDMNIKISEILATVIAVPPKATQGMNVASMKPYQFSQKVAEEEEHDANALPRQEDSLVRKHSEEESCEFHDCKEIQSEEVEHEAENTNMEISKDHDQELMTQGQGCIEAAVNASPTLNWVESEGLDREDNDSSCFMTQDRNPTQDPNFDYEYNHGTLYPW